MITTNVQLLFKFRKYKLDDDEREPFLIEMKVPDAVFSALRGPDGGHDGPCKSLGAAIIRKYLYNYLYGYQSNFSEAFGVKDPWNGVPMPDTWSRLWTEVERELTTISSHYCSHMACAVRELSDTLRREAALGNVEKAQVQLDIDGLTTLHEFWECMYAYAADTDKKPSDIKIYINEIKQALQNLIVFTAQHTEWSADHFNWQVPYS